jgi:hypothetical protein
VILGTEDLYPSPYTQVCVGVFVKCYFVVDWSGNPDMVISATVSISGLFSLNMGLSQINSFVTDICNYGPPKCASNLLNLMINEAAVRHLEVKLCN